MRLNYTLERTGCKSITAHQKGREESALLMLGVAPVPASQLSRYASAITKIHSVSEELS
jgi:hypothetical protein